MFRKILRWLDDHNLPVKLLIAVAAGIVFSMAASALTHEVLHLCGIFPPMRKPLFDEKLVVIALLFHSFYAVCAGMITARIAEEKARKAVFIMGSKETIVWFIGIFLLWKHTFAWQNLAKAALGIPLALLGGYLYRKLFKKEPAKKKARHKRASGVKVHAR